jgi:signal peptidase I
MRWKRKKKAKKPAYILRVVRHYGWNPGRIVSEILEWTEVIVVAVGLAVLIMSFITVRMHVPTDSMYPAINGDPSLLKADSFFVDRITYYFRDPKPGDIVVFRHEVYIRTKPPAEGSPAEQAGIQSGEYISTDQAPAYLGGRAVFTETAINETIAALPEGGSVSLRTAEGNTYDLGKKTSEQTLEEFGVRWQIKKIMYVKRLIAVGGQTVQIRGGDVYVDGEMLEGERFDQYYYSNDVRFQYGVEPTLVPEGYYFMLGDNSGDSFDARFWGFVPDKDIVGVPYLRVWPLNRFGVM